MKVSEVKILDGGVHWCGGSVTRFSATADCAINYDEDKQLFVIQGGPRRETVMFGLHRVDFFVPKQEESKAPVPKK